MQEYPNRALKQYTDLVFANEQSFLKEFCNKDASDLLNIYFGEETVKIIYLLDDGQHIADTIELVYFLIWVETCT